MSNYNGKRLVYNTRIKAYNDGSRQITTYSEPHSRGGSVRSMSDGSVGRSMTLEQMERYAKRMERDSAVRAKNHIFDLARSNVWQWFVTLTFNPDKVDSYDYDELTKRLSNWIDYVRRSCPSIRYLLVPEFHKKSGRIHFHGIMADCDALGFVDSGHKTPDGKTVYNIGRYSLGFTTATKIEDIERVRFYIGKYVTKDLLLHTKGKKRYWHSRNLNTPREEYHYYDLDSMDFVTDSVYHKTVNHTMPYGVEEINYYEYGRE